MDDTNTYPIENDEFFCRCAPEGEARCAEVQSIARTLLSKRGGDDFTLKLIYTLGIDSIGGLTFVADQWGAISVSHKGYRGYDEEEKSFFQCDDVIDGMAGAYLWLLAARLRTQLEDDRPKYACTYSHFHLSSCGGTCGEVDSL